MRLDIMSGVALVIVGFAAGASSSSLARARAASLPVEDMSQRQFLVSIDEIRQNFVFADKFTGTYKKTVTLSDGTRRDIELVPMIHDGMQVVEFKDTGSHTYMGLNGTTTNGTLMVQLADSDNMEKQLEAEGWNRPKR